MQVNAPPVSFPTKESLGGKREAAWSWRKGGRAGNHQCSCGSPGTPGPGDLSGRAGKQVWGFGVTAGPCEQLLGGFFAI